MRERKKFPALPLGFKSEVLETRMKFHRISRGRDFLEVELLRYSKPSQQKLCPIFNQGKHISGTE